MEGRFSKWFLRVKKGVINIFLCISIAYNVISCTEIAKNTQTLKIADFKYDIYLLVPRERARPELSEYVWQRGVESLQGRVTPARS